MSFLKFIGKLLALVVAIIFGFCFYTVALDFMLNFDTLNVPERLFTLLMCICTAAAGGHCLSITVKE